MILYHGTSKKFLESIIDNGLRPDSQQSNYGYDEDDYNIDFLNDGIEWEGGIPIRSLPYVYLTSSFSVATDYATFSAIRQNSTPSIITVSVNENILSADEDIVRNMIQRSIVEYNMFEMFPKILAEGDFTGKSETLKNLIINLTKDIKRDIGVDLSSYFNKSERYILCLILYLGLSWNGEEQMLSNLFVTYISYAREKLLIQDLDEEEERENFISYFYDSYENFSNEYYEIIEFASNNVKLRKQETYKTNRVIDFSGENRIIKIQVGDRVIYKDPSYE